MEITENLIGIIFQYAFTLEIIHPEHSKYRPLLAFKYQVQLQNHIIVYIFFHMISNSQMIHTIFLFCSSILISLYKNQHIKKNIFLARKAKTRQRHHSWYHVL